MSDGLILDSWEKVECLAQPACIFRGQGDSSWGLKPSLTRLLFEAGLNNPNDKDQVAKAVSAEEESLRVFQTAHSMPEDLREWIFWWAVAQHYGGVTRVLDWTQKIGVSVYFATSNNLDTGSPVRMSVQSGFFTSCTNVLHDHETVIRDRYAGALRKHIIPRESKPQLLREATMRGFSGAALFFDSSEKAGYAQRDEIVPNFQGWLVPCDLTGGKNGGKEIADYDPKNIRSDGIRT